jgi:hypothetical protein
LFDGYSRMPTQERVVRLFVLLLVAVAVRACYIGGFA